MTPVGLIIDIDKTRSDSVCVLWSSPPGGGRWIDNDHEFSASDQIADEIDAEIMEELLK